MIAVDGSAAMIAEARDAPRPGADDVRPLRPRRARTRRERRRGLQQRRLPLGPGPRAPLRAALPPPSSPGAAWRLSAEAPATSLASMRRLARSPPSRACRRSRPTTRHRFADPGETAAILAEAGFEAIDCGLVPRPVRPPEPREFIRTVCLGPHLALLPEGRRASLPGRRARAARPGPGARLRPAQHLGEKKGGTGLLRGRHRPESRKPGSRTASRNSLSPRPGAA